MGRRPHRPPRPVAKRAGGNRAGAGGRAEPARRAAGRGLGGEQVEGRQAVRELLLAGKRRVKEIWIAGGDGERARDGALEELADLAGDLRVPVRTVGRTKLDAAARTDAPQGIVAFAAPLPEADLDDLVRPGPDGKPFLVALDGVTDPGNLGAVLRSAECAGATGAVLPRHRSVHVTPAAAKAAAGAVEHVPIAVVPGLPAALERLKAAGLWIVGLDAGGDTPLHDLPFARDPVVLVLGAEGTGLSRLVRQRCDAIAAVPLRGRLASLNVGAAAAIATYEVARQRGFRPG